MKSNDKPEPVPVKGATKHMAQAKRHMTVRDVIERYVKTNEPIPEWYRERDPDEVIAEVKSKRKNEHRKNSVGRRAALIQRGVASCRMCLRCRGGSHPSTATCTSRPRSLSSSPTISATRILSRSISAARAVSAIRHRRPVPGMLIKRSTSLWSSSSARATEPKTRTSVPPNSVTMRIEDSKCLACATQAACDLPNGCTTHCCTQHAALLKLR